MLRQHAPMIFTHNIFFIHVVQDLCGPCAKFKSKAIKAYNVWVSLSRSFTTPRERPSSKQHVTKQVCVICTKTQHKGERQKFRICESSRAKLFLKATSYLQDEVFSRVADLESESRVFGADLMYHKLCLETYLRKYDRGVSSHKKERESSSKRLLFLQEVESIKELIDRGFGVPLSEIRDTLNEKYGDSFISNKEVKLFVIEHFGEDIQFICSKRKNESMILFSSVEDVVQKMKSIDIVNDTTRMIQQSLNTAEFGLDDKFGDAEELASSWNRCELPDILISFFATLFNIPQAILIKSFLDSDNIFECDDEDLDDALFASPQTARAVKVKSLYQMVYYILHNCKKKTPLHVMMGHHIYDKCKSREVITSLNRVGVSTSYNEVRRARSNLANYCFEKSEENSVPIPSHFVTDEFTLAQMDNFDHSDRSSLSDIHSNHDTVMTLIQIKPEFPPSKPNLSAFDLSRSRVNGYGKLPCQQLKTYIRKKKGLPLPSSFQVEDSVKSIIEDNDDEIKSFIINKLRGSVNSDELHIPTWAGCKSLISSANLPIMQVAFLLYLPHPVTDYSTVYTALCNFLSVLDQLKQDSFPLMCDECVFRIVAEIILQHPEQFKKIIPMMGNFHLAKAVEHFIGKFLKGSGFNDALVES